MAQETGQITVGRLAEMIGGQVFGDPNQPVLRAVPASGFADAGKTGDITFATDAKFLAEALTSGIPLIIAPRDSQAEGVTLLLHDSPRAAFGAVLALLKRPLPLGSGVSQQAVVSETARVAETAQIGAFAVVESGALIGENAKVFPFAYVGENCIVGAKSIIYPHAVLYQDVRLGERCIVHSGAVVGADGFGFAWDGKFQRKIEQLGGVTIGNDVEIGANTCIDRATCGETVIEDDVKLDNMVQIAHNVRIGEHTVMASQVGIAGSTTIGKGVVFGGQAGSADHVEVADGAMFAARAGVWGNISEPGGYAGFPATPVRKYMKVQALVMKLPELFERIKALEKSNKQSEE